MDLFKDYYDIGKNGSPDKFLAAFKKHKSYATDTKRKNGELMNGAVAALHLGHPENVQTAILHAAEIENHYYAPHIIPSFLYRVSQDSGNVPSSIAIAVGQIIHASEKQAVLNKALNDAIVNNIGGEPFFKALIDAGADANADINGPAGILATAVSSAAPLSFIKHLHDKGVSFDEALATLHNRGSKTEDVDRLEFYRGKVAAGAREKTTAYTRGLEEAMIKVLQTVLELRDQISSLNDKVSDLSERVDRLSGQQPPAANENPPETPEKKPVRKYPKL